MRVAESRVAALDAVTSTREHVGRCVRALPVLKRVAIVAGAAASVVGVCAGLRSRKKSAQKIASGTTSAAGMLQIVMQLAGPMLLPVVQKYLAKRASETQGKTVSF